MLGMVCPQSGGALWLERVRIAGMGVVCAHLPTGGRWENRRLTGAVRGLRRAGVSRILPHKDYKPALPLPWAEWLPLYRALAHRFILARLAQRGSLPGQGTVVLRGEYPDGDLTAAAYGLCPSVRQVVIDTGRSGVDLQRRLYRAFGLTVGPVLPGEDVFCVRFSGEATGEDLLLCEGAEPAALSVEAPGIELPEYLEPPPLLCALWQAGRLNLGQLQISENKCT